VWSVALLPAVAYAANDKAPHFHQGKLAPYEIGPPSLMLSSDDETELRAGNPIMQTVVADDSCTRRLIMVRDIEAPAQVVMGRILDIKNYPRMVQGVDRVRNYLEASNPDGTQEVRSVYDIHVLHFKLRYFMKHVYDPAQRCLVFHLDYERQSDLDDSVGYWFLMPQGRSTTRVFYSCDTKLRGWFPAPVYNLLGKAALKQATTWVHGESLKEWALVQQKHSAEGAPKRFFRRMQEAWDDAQTAKPLPEFRVPSLNDWLEKRRAAGPGARRSSPPSQPVGTGSERAVSGRQPPLLFTRMPRPLSRCQREGARGGAWAARAAACAPPPLCS